MTILGDFGRPDAREAQENLRVIRSLMERPTKYSTFSGLSGILAGAGSLAGCAITSRVILAQGYTVHGLSGSGAARFLALWACVTLFAVAADYMITKRRAATVGKYIRSRLGRQMVLSSAPGLFTGALLSVYFLSHGDVSPVYAIWMLCYGLAVCAVGQFSQREVSFLGLAFLISGTVTLWWPAIGLWMMAAAFGGFHIVYGVIMARKDGW